MNAVATRRNRAGELLPITLGSASVNVALARVCNGDLNLAGLLDYLVNWARQTWIEDVYAVEYDHHHIWCDIGMSPEIQRHALDRLAELGFVTPIGTLDRHQRLRVHIDKITQQTQQIYF